MSDKPAHYNLAWYYPYRPEDGATLRVPDALLDAVPTPEEIDAWGGTRHDVAQVEYNTLEDLQLTPAVILFPALCTPLIVYGDLAGFDRIELLIVSRDELTPELVNRQLKVCIGLDPYKRCAGEPLFGGAHDETIKVEKASDDDGVWSTATRFRGLVAQEVLDALREVGLDQWFRVSLDPACLARTGDDFRLSTDEPRDDGTTALVGTEFHDVLTRQLMAPLLAAGGADRLAGGGLYCFAQSRHGVDICEAAYDLPVQAYHPVFVHKAASDDAAIGFLSDIHVNSRLRILGRSTARVIEYDATDPLAAESPRVGDLVMETNRSFASTLRAVCSTNPTAIVLGGDFIDHLRNAYAPRLTRAGAAAPTPAEIWDAVSMEGGAYTLERYPRYVDTTAFYSLIVHASIEHAAPFIAITGNHDAYDNAFGISPHAWILGQQRPNEGIPADLNLTLYEALLAFGPSSGSITESMQVVSKGASDLWNVEAREDDPRRQQLVESYPWFDLPGRALAGKAYDITQSTDAGPMFDAVWFPWFYAMLTPFTDASLSFPDFNLVALGWGHGEDMGSPGSEGQGLSHLPRANKAMSAEQVALLEAASEEAKKVVLATHFTVASYKENLRLPSVGFKRVTRGAFTDSEMGTCELNAKPLLEKVVSGAISCVLSGHSHRRGLYTMPVVAEPAPILGFDLPEAGFDIASFTSPPKCVLVVSDSCGPYPKRNVRGEFDGYGMDRPSGTLVQLRRGSPTRVDPVFAARGRPRAAVALDFCDVLKQSVFASYPDFGELELAPAPGEHAGTPSTPGYNCWVTIALSSHARTDWGLTVSALRLVRWLEGSAPTALTLEQGLAAPTWRVWREQSEAAHLLGAPLRDGRSRWFLSLHLATSNVHLAHDYDWASVWHIEVEPQRVRSAKNLTFKLHRPLRSLAGLGPDQSWPEVPDFAWRANAMPEKYGGP